MKEIVKKLIQNIIEGSTAPTTIKALIGTTGLKVSNLDEQDLVKLVWKKLDPKIKSQLDINTLRKFVEYLEGGDNLASAAKNAKLDITLAFELVSDIEKMGLL